MTGAALFAELFEQGFDRLAEEVRAYPDDAGPWRAEGTIPNPGGALVHHLCGNVRHFVGAVLGRDGYVRDRPAEFGDRDLTREALLGRVEEARAAARAALEGLQDGALDAPYPGTGPGTAAGSTTGAVLVHLWGHFQYHLGQLDYHRRLLEREG